MEASAQYLVTARQLVIVDLAIIYVLTMYLSAGCVFVSLAVVSNYEYLTLIVII